MHAGHPTVLSCMSLVACQLKECMWTPHWCMPAAYVCEKSCLPGVCGYWQGGLAVLLLTCGLPLCWVAFGLAGEVGMHEAGQRAMHKSISNPS